MVICSVGGGGGIVSYIRNIALLGSATQKRYSLAARFSGHIRITGNRIHEKYIYICIYTHIYIYTCVHIYRYINSRLCRVRGITRFLQDAGGVSGSSVWGWWEFITSSVERFS